MNARAENRQSHRALEKQYFDEARSWDLDAKERIKRSEKRAWFIAGAAVLVAVLEAGALVGLTPLKSVEPFVIRVDNNTGLVDVVSTLAETDGDVTEKAQEALDKYWLSNYIRHRENYQWETRDFDRQMVGLLSDSVIQQSYAAYTDPRLNSAAPVAVYGQNTEVEARVKAISIINSETVENGEKRTTALVRYTKQVKRAGERTPLTHWAATVTFVYLDTSMKVEDRLLNPLGFQVVKYRNDQESMGG
ncbi:conjugal transfer protein TraJ [Marinobacterium nitratireducens]|uniref:Conjugal transfer protein TraJ n=1 Tax=Marinobacterium nitratireducens TaxID=518897 RepID=A0A917ZL11_9GAMM|nr:VirB8/TrbF family protein [Marinobacterium nitratireducens]GGO83777.1 conjugal transfer protein TraJ [Marinobacterium nitratireducens]